MWLGIPADTYFVGVLRPAKVSSWLFQPFSLAPGWLYLSFVLLWAFQWEGECPGSLNRARIVNSRMKAYFATLLSTDWFFYWMTEGWLVARIPHKLHLEWLELRHRTWLGKGRFEIEFQSKGNWLLIAGIRLFLIASSRRKGVGLPHLPSHRGIRAGALTKY